MAGPRPHTGEPNVMHHRVLIPLATLAFVVAACGGGSGPTQAAGTPAGGGGGGTPTDAAAPTAGPAATQSGGDGSNFANGKAHFEISGTQTKSGDLGFLPVASHFGGTTQTILNFVTSDPSVTETLTVTLTEGAVAIIYSSMDITVTGVECATSNLNVAATTASGSFDCSKTYAVLISGASVEGVVLNGTFEARA
jgi:hypothetical protein